VRDDCSDGALQIEQIGMQARQLPQIFRDGVSRVVFEHSAHLLFQLRPLVAVVQ